LSHRDAREDAPTHTEADEDAGPNDVPYVHSDTDAELRSDGFADSFADAISHTDADTDPDTGWIDESRSRGSRAVRIRCDARVRVLDLAPISRLTRL